MRYLGSIVVVVEGEQDQCADQEQQDAARSRRIRLREKDGFERAEDDDIGLLEDERGAQRTALCESEQPEEPERGLHEAVLEDAKVEVAIETLGCLSA